MNFFKNIFKFFYDSIIIVSFLSLILFKLNTLYNHFLSTVEVFILIGILTLLGSSFLKKCGQQIIATKSFQWLLFHFLNFKNILYQIIDDFLVLCQELGIIGTFITSIWVSGLIAQVIWNFFIKTGFFFQLHLFIPMFFFSLFNMVERLLIFNPKHIQELQKNNKSFEFEHALFFLGTPLSLKGDQKKFKKLKLIYIQKRYIYWSKTIPSSFKYLIPFGGGIGFSAQWFLNYQEFVFQKDSFERKFEFGQQQAKLRSDREERQFVLSQLQVDLENRDLMLREKQFKYQKEQDKKSSWTFW